MPAPKLDSSPHRREAADETRAFLDALVEAGDLSGAVALVGDGEEVAWAVGAGERVPGRPVSTADRFDLASLTKPFVATLALALDRSRRFPLNEPIGRRPPEAPDALSDRTWADLLRHRGGFIPWLPLYRTNRSRRRVYERLLRPDVLGAPRGTYSDLGYIFWSLSVERSLGRSIEALLRREVLEPLGIDGVSSGGVRRTVACPLDNATEVRLAAGLGIRVAHRRGPEIGEAQDGNTRFLGGVPGHAGLFGSASSVWRLGAAWLRGEPPVGVEARDAIVDDRHELGLGWRKRRRRGSAGPALGRRSFGHPGFTGTSLWVDPDAGRVYVLLAHRTRVDVDIDAHRRRFHELAAGS